MPAARMPSSSPSDPNRRAASRIPTRKASGIEYENATGKQACRETQEIPGVHADQEQLVEADEQVLGQQDEGHGEEG